MHDWAIGVDRDTRTVSLASGGRLSYDRIVIAPGIDFKYESVPGYGLEATSHWNQLERLRDYGAIPLGERVVERGKVITAAGVSAGIDMGLQLVSRIADEATAQAIQLSIEYDPAPPFDAGHPSKAPKPVLEFVEGVMAKRRAAYSASG